MRITGADMTSGTAYAMAEYFRKHGFSAGLGDDGGPRCFIGAHASVTNGRIGPMLLLHDHVGSFDTLELMRARWNQERAIAVCRRVGDELAAAEAKRAIDKMTRTLQVKTSVREHFPETEEVT